MSTHAPLFASAPDGVAIAYDVAGEGRPVVLVHGFASSREQNWISTGWIGRLVQAGFRVVSFDLRGHGHSGKPHDVAAYGETMVGDILAVMAAAGAPVADVMGYSMGAMLTISLVMRHPERVRRAVVAGIGETYFDDQTRWRNMVADAVLTEDTSAIEDHAARRFRIFSGQKGKDRLALAACMRSARKMYSPAELKQSERPVLVVVGEKDDLTGSPYPLAQAFADGRALLVPNKDHMTVVGDPGYKRAVIEFLSE
jgi:pimeloyl-ACP methyl ester carboxylesterase